MFYVSQYVFQQLYNNKRGSFYKHMILLLHVSTCSGYLQENGKGKGKVHPRTGH